MNQSYRPARRADHVRHRVLFAVLVTMCCWVLSGCVQRRLTIHSNPPGALVKVDEEEIGTTPVSTSFVYYGTRKIQIVKPGYETLTVLQPVPAPWYQWPGLDFVSEHFVPGKVHDYRTLSYDLKPATVFSTDQLLQRADQLRGEAGASSTLETTGAPLAVPGNLPLPAQPQPRRPPPFEPGLQPPASNQLPF